MRKQILVSVDRGETRVAVREAKGDARPGRGSRGGAGSAPPGSPAKGSGDFQVAELYVERRGQRSIVGNIYKGVIDNVLPGMEAAFVDIGLERNGFLHVDEIVLPGGQAAPKRGRGGGRRIDELIKPKQEILVQVVKDPLKTKGARLSMQLSIAGRYLVYMPQGEGVGVSRRVPDSQREKLRKLLDGARKKRKAKFEGGLIVRTAAQGAEAEDFEREIGYLLKLHEVLERRAEQVEAPDLVFQEADLSVRVVRDVLRSEFEGAVIDDPKQHQRVTSFFERTAPELVDSVELYKDRKPLFEAYGVDATFEEVLSRRVDLPSGGYLIIDYAEALTVIDINTGSFTGRGKGGLEGTITRVNVEAAEEVVRQLRLRDIGGIIVIDFIDMARSKNRDQVLKTLRKALDLDKTKSYVMEVSPLGLVEMTRQNVTDGVREILTIPCPTCDGEGVVLSAETVAFDVLRRLRDVVEDQPEPDAYLIRVNPKVAAQLLRGDSALHDFEQESSKHFHFEGGEALPIDTFEVIEAGSREQIAERALPFQVGDEVLLTVEEPHMYNANDAIGRVDSYIVSIAGAGRFVGDRRMVRIESVDRAVATALLLGEDGEPLSQESANGGGSELESDAGGRRRGRRGGRGRRARAETGTGGGSGGSSDDG